MAIISVLLGSILCLVVPIAAGVAIAYLISNGQINIGQAEE